MTSPARWTKELNWKETQLKIEQNSLDCKIKKEIDTNEGGSIWRDRKAILVDCVAKNKDTCSADTHRRRIMQISKHVMVFPAKGQRN